jgi:uncharacterized membrane protein YadS
MNKINFPYVALGLGLFILLVLIGGVEARNDGSNVIPLLTLLVASEFAFFVTAIGGYIGFRHIKETGIRPLYTGVTVLCILLSIGFLLLGVALWPK